VKYTQRCGKAVHNGKTSGCANVSSNSSLADKVCGLDGDLKRNVGLHAHVRMHRVMFCISNTLRKLMIGLRVWCLGKCVGLGFGLEKEK